MFWQKFEDFIMNSNNLFNRILSLILLIWVLICTYMIFNNIGGHIIVCHLFLAIISLVILIYGWGFLGNDYTQSLEYLVNNNPLEFTVRVIIIILTLFVGLITAKFIIDLFLIGFLFAKIRIFDSKENSLVTFWKNRNIKMIILCLLFFILYFSYLL